jgi:hypothetical protein
MRQSSPDFFQNSLKFSTDRKLMAATIRINGPNLEMDPPKMLFQTRLFSTPLSGQFNAENSDNDRYS